MGAYLIKNDASLGMVLEEAIYPQAVLAANPLTAALAADFDAILAQWAKVNEKETQLRIARVKASALVAAADDALDGLVDAISQAVLLEVKNNRKAPQYLLYFGNKAPNEMKRPVLGGQLETMRGWVPSLTASANPTLKGLGTQLQDAVAAADAAVKGQGEAEQAMRDFRTIGERRGLIDGLNGVRKATYGKLAEMPHAMVDKHLPATFAEQFFRPESRKPAGKGTAEELAAEIASLETQLAELKEQLAKVTAEEETAAKAKAEEEAHAAAIAAAEKEAEAAAAKVAALKAQKK